MKFYANMLKITTDIAKLSSVNELCKSLLNETVLTLLSCLFSVCAAEKCLVAI